MPEHDEKLLVLSSCLRALARNYADRELYRTVMARAAIELDPAASFTLIQLLESAPIRSTDLAATLRIDPSTASRHITALTQLDFVERRADQNDGRASLLHLTESGYAAASRLLDEWLGFNRLLLEDMHNGDIERLIELLEVLLDQYPRARASFLHH